jgi:Family of unknown function (DUF5681)
MSKKNRLDDYEVGYGKPPKNTRFQKGVSGNPRGRPKKAPHFDTELIREAKSLIIINDNGERKSISKFQGIVKQLTNKAMTGNMPARSDLSSSYSTSVRQGRPGGSSPGQQLPEVR